MTSADPVALVSLNSADPVDPADSGGPRRTRVPADPAARGPGDFRGPGGPGGPGGFRGDFRGPGGPGGPDFRGPDNHDWRPPWNPGDNDWRGRFHGAPWGDGLPPWGWGAPPPPPWDGPLPEAWGPPAAADQLLGLQRATGVGSGLQPVGLLLLRDLDSAPDLTCRQDGRLDCTGAAVLPGQFT